MSYRSPDPQEDWRQQRQRERLAIEAQAPLRDAMIGVLTRYTDLAVSLRPGVVRAEQSRRATFPERNTKMAKATKAAPKVAVVPAPAAPVTKDPFKPEDLAPVPKGFKELEQTAAIEYTDLGPNGRVATYKGARKVIGKKDKKEFTLHEFEENELVGWGLWGCATLDAKLAKVKPGAEVWIRYGGKIPHPTDATKTLHTFQVATRGGTSLGTLASEPMATEDHDENDLPF